MCLTNMAIFTKLLLLINLLLLFTSTLAVPSSPLPRQPSFHTKKVLLPSGKRGLPYLTSVSSLSDFNSPSSHVTWAYDWSSTMDPAFPAYLEYVPMLWNTAQLKSTNWTANVEKAIKRGTKNILAFNEPDLSSQANMTPAEAATAYMSYIQPYAGRVNLGGPAVTESASGTAWLSDFLSKCTKCTIDFIPVHIYSTATDIGHYQRHIQDIHTLTGKPIWVTEFHASGTEASQITFLETLMPWLDAQAYVLRYAWYKCSTTYTAGTLCAANGQLSALGQVFETYTG